MPRDYGRQRLEFREFIEAIGCPWECGKCGATDKPLDLRWDGPSNANPPPLSEIAKMLSFIEWDEQKVLVSERLLCVKCRHSQDRLVARLAAAGVPQKPTLVSIARQGGYGMTPPAVTQEVR